MNLYEPLVFLVYLLVSASLWQTDRGVKQKDLTSFCDKQIFQKVKFHLLQEMILPVRFLCLHQGVVTFYLLMKQTAFESLNRLWFVFSILCRLILFWFDFLFLSFHFLCVKAGQINRLPPVSCSKPTSLSTSPNVWYLFYLWYLLSALFQGLMWCVSSLSRLF